MTPGRETPPGLCTIAPRRIPREGNDMPLVLDKALTLLALPLGVAVGAGLLALAASALGRRRAAVVLTAFAVVWLWGWSTPLPTGAIVGPLADPYPVRRIETLPAADAIVLLGGGIKPPGGDMVYPDLRDSADRIWHAARLYHAGKAPLIISSAGNVWGGPKRPSKAHAMRMLLEAFGVPDHAIVIEDSSRNTRENAVFTERIASGRGIGRVLLVTSYWHLRRAEAAFRRVGLDVVPVAIDYTDGKSSFGKPIVLALLPSVGALSFNSMLFKEHMGYLVYRLRAWV